MGVTKIQIDGVDLEAIEPQYIDQKILGIPYRIKEASAGIAVQYRNAVMKSMVMNQESGQVTLRDAASVEPLLISLCVHEIVEGEPKPNPIPLQTVNKWPNRIQKAIFNAIHEMSGLQEESILAKLLIKILSRPDSPVDVGAFFAWLTPAVRSDKEFKPLLVLIPENLPKNSQGDTTEN